MKKLFLVLLLSITSFAQAQNSSDKSDDNPNVLKSNIQFLGLDINNLKTDSAFSTLYIEGNWIEPYKELGDNIIIHLKVGVGSSSSEFGNDSSSAISVPIQLGPGYLYREGIFNVYGSVTGGVGLTYSSVEIGGVSDDNFDVDFISTFNAGTIIFFGENTSWGITAEYNVGITTSGDRVMIGIAGDF